MSIPLARVAASAAALAGLLLLPGHAGAQSRCAKLQFRTAGSFARATMACHAKAAATGTAVDAACLAAAEAELARRWEKALAKGDCPTAATSAEASAIGGEFASEMQSLVTPPAVSHCCVAETLCFAGPSIDVAGCEELVGTLGAPGTVCDGAGACVPPPATGGPCCAIPSFGSCITGPSVEPTLCVEAGGTPAASAVCDESGACVAP